MGTLPAGTATRGLTKEALQRSLVLAPSMSWIHDLWTKESLG